MIRNATPEDKQWIEPIFKREDHILGKGFFGTIWYRYWQAVEKKGRERWIVIPEVAFAHYRERKDGVKVLMEIAVTEKRKGFGRELMRNIGLPMELKTDADHLESNAFYKALGFYPAGEKRSRDGKKRLRIWLCAQS